MRYSRNRMEAYRIAEAELNVLRALCQDTRECSVWAAAKQLLTCYRFRDPSHQLVFDALCQLPKQNPALLRELLPGRITR